MQITPISLWRLEFARGVDVERYREITRRAQDEARRDQKRRDDKEKDREERQNDLDDLLEVVALASVTQVEGFHVTVDRYDAATYEALIANEKLLVRLYRERDEMLGKAYVLPDGTRVFEMEDGLRVIDEFGRELDPSVVTPDDIEDWRPKGDGYLLKLDEIAVANEQRATLVDYQQKLADVRERAKVGEVTTAELAAFEKELADEMPDAVRERLLPEHRPADADLEKPVLAEPTSPVQQVQQARDAPTF